MVKKIYQLFKNGKSVGKEHGHKGGKGNSKERSISAKGLTSDKGLPNYKIPAAQLPYIRNLTEILTYPISQSCLIYDLLELGLEKDNHYQ